MFSVRSSIFRACALGVSLFLAATLTGRAEDSVTLTWQRNKEQNISGYRVYYGTKAQPFSELIDVKNNSARIPNLVTGKTYTFAVSAYNVYGIESELSPSVSFLAGSNPSASGVTLDNISSRVFVQTGPNVMIGGFIVQGKDKKRLALRAIGPSLAAAGVKGALADPFLELRNASGKLIASNDDWRSADRAALSDLGLAPTDNREAALIVNLPAGSYSAAVRGKSASRGVALFELYNLDRSTGSVANISTRGRVETGDKVMIGGFIIGGSKRTKVIVRAIGPSLEAQGVPDALKDPTLELYDSDGSLVATNDNWRSDQQAAIINSTVPPTDNREAAIVATLAPGAYSAVIRGHGQARGVALFEVYALSH